MQENTNKAIVVNSLFLYIKLGVSAITGLLSTRFALKALGANDFGIFSVVGGIVSLITIVNTIMLSTSNRFMATAIGRGEKTFINSTFNVNVAIYIIIAILTIIIAYPLGDWYILRHINYSGNINDVLRVYHITIVGSVISFLGVPYNGLLLAKERFIVFTITDIVSNIIKVIISYLLIYYFVQKLSIYAITIGFCAAFPTFVFMWYCHRMFPDIVTLKFVKNTKMYKEVLNFSVWVGYGAIASVGKTQGAALIVNHFFNTIMNTALGISNSVHSILLLFAHNVSKSIAPQIVKSYAAGDMKRAEDLVVLSSKISYLIMLMISSPFLVASHWVFTVWLNQVPPYVILFTQLMIIDTLIGTLNAGIPELIFATGKISWYQFLVNTIFLISIVVAYWALKAGFPAFYLLVTYILFSVVALIVRQIVLNRVVKFNNWVLLKKSYFPSITITLLFLPMLLLRNYLDPFWLIIISSIYLGGLCYFIGLSKKEKKYFRTAVKKRLHTN